MENNQGFSTKDLTVTKSDRLNAADIMSAPRRIKITGTREVKSKDCLMDIYYEGGDGKPWKPCKTVIRTLSAAWGDHTGDWVDKEALLYYEPSAVYAGQEVGGIRVKALSHLSKAPMNVTVYEKRGKPTKYVITLLEPVQLPDYPQSAIDKNMPKWVAAVESGKMTQEQIINGCSSKGNLTDEQKTQIRNIGKGDADLIIDEDESGFFNDGDSE